MNLIGQYTNGNYEVKLYEDGTKIRETEDDNFIPEFPECMDVKITNYCDMGCKYCHENSTTEGLHGDIMNPEFINTLKPHTELALGGGNPLAHPDIIPFLEKLKERNLIANMTVNQYHFEKDIEKIKHIMDNDLIKGLGVSLMNPTESFLDEISNYPNAVIHVINGILTEDNMKALYKRDLKILILGYKMFRRGNDFYSQTVEDNKTMLYNNLAKLAINVKVVSFDNLAIKQLEVKRLMPQSTWDEFYMGDDGRYTMYVDLVEEKFAPNSTSVDRWDLFNDIIPMFKYVNDFKDKLEKDVE